MIVFGFRARLRTRATTTSYDNRAPCIWKLFDQPGYRVFLKVDHGPARRVKRMELRVVATVGERGNWRVVEKYVQSQGKAVGELRQLSLF